MLKIIALVSYLLFTPAVAQTCFAELQGDTPAETLQQIASASDAVLYLERAVNLLEPVLPRFEGNFELDGLAPTDPAYESANFLATRGLLPESWQAAELSRNTWLDMLTGLASWYELVPTMTSFSAKLTRQQLLADLSLLIERIVPRLKPVLLVASRQDDHGAIGFLAILRNDTVYPRMIVVRPPEEQVDLSEDVNDILATLETCAMPLKRHIYAPEQTATRLFLANNDARMVIVETDPLPLPWPIYIPLGDELDYLRFADPNLGVLERYAVVFVGQNLGVMTALRIIPQLRTNMSPREILDFLRHM